MSVIIFLLVLSLLILIHEFGHFITAKERGVKVFEFALGFPPTLYKKTIRGTQYVLNALPFGGYVRLLGENGEDDVPNGSEYKEEEFSGQENFSKKSAITKTYILAAGVAMNMLLAWILLSVCLMFGYPSETSSLKASDAKYVTHASSIITYVEPGSPAEAAGLKPSDTLLQIEDSTRNETLESAAELGKFIRASDDKEITLTVLRGKERLILTIPTVLGIDGVEENTRAIGVMTTDVSTVRYPVYIALYEGARWTVNATTQTITGLAGLLTDALRGKGDLSHISGPVGIVNLVGDAYSIGFLYLLSFTAIISINLAIVNLLPIPALDGGRILFVWIETLKGSPITMKTQLVANGIGFALLILLMLFITANDIRNLFM